MRHWKKKRANYSFFYPPVNRPGFSCEILNIFPKHSEAAWGTGETRRTIIVALRVRKSQTSRFFVPQSIYIQKFKPLDILNSYIPIRKKLEEELVRAGYCYPFFLKSFPLWGCFSTAISIDLSFPSLVSAHIFYNMEGKSSTQNAKIERFFTFLPIENVRCSFSHQIILILPKKKQLKL